MDINYVYVGIAIFIGFSIFIAVYALISSKKTKLTRQDVRIFSNRWKSIMNKIPGEPQIAILEADKLLHKALEKSGYDGSLGEILKQKPHKISSLDNTWYAHKVRNRIAHDFDYRVEDREAKKVLKYYKEALRDLSALR